MSGAAFPTSFHPAPAASIGLPAIACLLAAAAIALPPGAGDATALVAIIGLGIPHGALDVELARTRLKGRHPVAWFGVFALPYLSLSALVLLAWIAAPMWTLAVFLAVSVWHFGTEETGGTSVPLVLGAGGLPIAVAVLVHPAATAAIFGTVANRPLSAPPPWLTDASVGWLVPAAIRLAQLGRSGDRRAAATTAATAGAAILLPPLMSFAIYFVCVHAPAHVRALIADRRLAPRIVDGWSAITLSLPVTGLTLLIGALLWPLYGGEGTSRLLCLTIQGLSALTLPHLALEGWLHRRDARGPARQLRSRRA